VHILDTGFRVCDASTGRKDNLELTIRKVGIDTIHIMSRHKGSLLGTLNSDPPDRTLLDTSKNQAAISAVLILSILLAVCGITVQ